MSKKDPAAGVRENLKKKNADPSHSHGSVTMNLSYNDCSTIYIYVLLHCMETGRQVDNLAIDARELYDDLNIRFFLPK